MAIITWFASSTNKKLVNDLLKQVKIEKFAPMANIGGPLIGKTFVLTGTLTAMSRDEAKKKIKSLGGHVVGSVSGSTDFLVAGENPGSKYDNAKRLGIPVLSENEFLKIITL